MSSLIVIGILTAMGAGVWYVAMKEEDKQFRLLYPDEYKAEIENAFSLAKKKLEELKHEQHGVVRVVVKRGNERYGKRWGYKKPNGNLVGATTSYHPANGSQVVTLYTDSQGYEQPDEILHEFGHVVLNFDKEIAYENGNYHHTLMRKYGFPLC